MNKIFTYIKKHKIASVVLIVALAAGYYYYTSTKTTAAPIRYVLGTVTRGAIITSVSGSGQVAAVNQLEIKPTISADITSIKVKVGDKVKTGDVLATLDAADLQITARNQKNALATAQANLALKTAGLTKEDLAVAKNTLATSKLSYENSIKTLVSQVATAEQFNLPVSAMPSDVSVAMSSYKTNNSVAYQAATITYNTDRETLLSAYKSARSDISSAESTMRSALVSADGILGFNNFNSGTTPYKYLLGVRDSSTLSDANLSYEQSKSQFDAFEADYGITSANMDSATIEQYLLKTAAVLQTMKTMEHNIYLVMINSVVGTDLSQATLDGFKSTAVSQENSLTSAINNLQADGEAITRAKTTIVNNLDSAQNDILNKKLSYESAQASYNLKIAPPRPIDLVTLKIQIDQAAAAYQKALEDLKNATIRAPFDGIIAAVNQTAGDQSVATAATPATAMFTLITPKQLASVTLNEVDSAKVRVGQKAIMTFNAVDGLSITGEVVSIDTIGTITQNVVSYNAKIAFDTQDDRIKPEMSVSASITTNEKLDALVVPNSAVKTDNSGASYVETLNLGNTPVDPAGNISATPPDRKTVVTGLVSDTNTEIVSGLNEGDQIIVRTIGGAAQTAQTQTRQNGGGLLGGFGR